MIELLKLQDKISAFAEKRNWSRYHTKKNLIQALQIEVSELSEIFLWKTDTEIDDTLHDTVDRVKDEMGDIFIYLLMLSDSFNIDLIEAVNRKLAINEQKYPVDKARNNSKKYTEF